MEGSEAKLIISQSATIGLARDFRESVVYSVGIIGDQTASLFYYHARQNYNGDPSQLPLGRGEVRPGLAKSVEKRSDGGCKGMREETIGGSRGKNRTVSGQPGLALP